MRMAALVIGIGLTLGIMGCGEDPGTSCLPGQAGDELAITQVNNGCGDSLPSEWAGECVDALLTGYTYEDGTVSLAIRFVANCCPEFETTGRAGAHGVEIDVIDHLYACKCLCYYENDFIFTWATSDTLSIAFDARYVPPAGEESPCVSALDTVIVLR